MYITFTVTFVKMYIDYDCFKKFPSYTPISSHELLNDHDDSTFMSLSHFINLIQFLFVFCVGEFKKLNKYVLVIQQKVTNEIQRQNDTNIFIYN